MCLPCNFFAPPKHQTSASRCMHRWIPTGSGTLTSNHRASVLTIVTDGPVAVSTLKGVGEVRDLRDCRMDGLRHILWQYCHIPLRRGGTGCDAPNRKRYVRRPCLQSFLRGCLSDVTGFHLSRQHVSGCASSCGGACGRRHRREAQSDVASIAHHQGLSAGLEVICSRHRAAVRYVRGEHVR